jgi:hypothetical protein
MTATLTMLGLAWETDFILAVFGATTLGGTPAFGTTFGGADAVFDEAAPTLFDIAVTLEVATLFFSGTFTHFPAGPTQASIFLFLVASVLARMRWPEVLSPPEVPSPPEVMSRQRSIASYSGMGHMSADDWLSTKILINYKSP